MTFSVKRESILEETRLTYSLVGPDDINFNAHVLEL